MPFPFLLHKVTQAYVALLTQNQAEPQIHVPSKPVVTPTCDLGSFLL